MAVNVLKYAKNVARSFGYAAVDVMGDLNPVIKSFSESNEDLGKELYSAVTDWKGTVKKAKTAVIDSDIYEFAAAYKKNLFEDLKNGTFYNKTREEEYAERIGGVSDEQLKSEFDDMFDDDMGLDGWDEADFASDMFMAETIDDVGGKIANSNAEVTARSAEYIVRGHKESTKVLYEQNNRLFGEALKGMAAINANIGQFSGAIADISQTHANNAKVFFENTDRKLDRITELLDSINKNTATSSDLKKSQENKDKNLTFYDIVDSKGMPNLKKYFEVIKKNIKENAGEMGAIGDIFGSGENVLMAFAASPLQELTKTVVKQVIPNVVEKSMAEFNDTLQGFFGSAISLLNKQKGSDNPLLDWAAKIFGIEGEYKTNIDTSKYEKGRVPWDGASRKALVEIIPAQLSRIISALTGEAPTIFNPESGRMESVRQLKENSDWRIKSAANYAGADLRSMINQIISDSKMSFETKDAKDSFYNDLDALIFGAFNNGGLSAKDLNSTGLINLGVSGNMTLLEDILKRIQDSPEGRRKLLNLNRRILSERDSLNKTYRRLEESGSVEAMLENGMFDEFFEKDKKDKDFRKNTGFKGVRGSGISGIFDQIDNYGHSMFYYAQEMFKRQDAIYKFTGFMVDNWGAGSGGGKKKRKGSTRKIATDLTDISPDIDKLSDSLDYIEDEHEKRDNEWYIQNRDKFRQDNEDYVGGYYTEEQKRQFHLNVDAEEYARKREDENAPKNWIDKMLSEKTLTGKLGTLQTGVQGFINKPLESFAKMLGAADDRMYKLIYGDAGKELEDLGFLGILKQNVEGFFSKANDWIDNKILNPLKAKLGLNEGDSFLKKLLGEERYDRYKLKMQDGIIGKKGEDGRRSGGLLGDYIQSIKDNAKDAWDWTKDAATDVKNEIGDAFGGAFSKYRGQKAMDTYATGGQVKKTGIAAVSEGELIIPSELNPFYHGKTDKKKQIRDENRAVQRFFGNYSLGTTGVGVNAFNSGSEEGENEINAALTDKIVDTAKKKGITLDTLKYQLRLAQAKLTDNDIVTRVNILKREARKFVFSYKKFHDVNDGTNREAKIVDFDKGKKQYVTDDGQVRNLKPGEWIRKEADGQLSKMAQSATGFVGDMGSELNSAWEEVKKVYYRNMKEDGRKGDSDTQSQVFGEMVDDLKGNFFKGENYAGSATVGAGIGAGLGMLVGMPFLGAAVGGAVGLAKKSNGVQKFLFGEDTVDDQGNATKKGGIFSKKTQKFIEEKLPGMAKWGLAGAAAGLVLPGGPIVGTMLGASIAYAKDSETLSDVLFSEKDSNGNYTKRGALKLTKEEFEGKLKKKLPKMGLGAAAGALIGGPFGIVGNMVVGSAIGFATDSEAFRSAMLGHVGSDGERHGGLVEHITDNIKGLFGFGKEETKGLAQFFKEDVMDPMVGVIPPLVKELEMLGNKFKNFGKGFGNVMKSIFGESYKDFGGFLDKGPFKAAKAIGKDLAHGAIGLAKFPLTIIPQMAGGLSRYWKRHQLGEGAIDYMTASERLQERDNIDNAAKDRIDKIKGRFKNVKDDFNNKEYLSMVGSALSAIGQGAYDVSGGLVSDLIGSFGMLDKDNIAFSNMDVWMDNASEEELDETLKLLYRVQDAGGAWEKEKAGIVETMRGDAASLRYLDQKSREKIFKAASKGSTLVDLNKVLSKAKTKDNKDLTDIQRQQIINMFTPGMDRIRDVKLNKIDIEKQSQEAFDALRSNPIFAPLVNDEENKFDNTRVQNLISQILYEKSAGNVSEQDRGKLKGVEPDSPEALQIKTQTDFLKEQHDETVDLLKVLINAVTAMGKGTDDEYEIPYADAGAISGVNVDFGRKFRLAQEEKARKAKEEENFKKKYGDREADDGIAATDEVPLPDDKMEGQFALGGMIGAAIQKNIVTPEGNFLYDTESHEYKAADSETIAKVKRKADMQDSIIEIPDKIDKLISTMGGNPNSNGDDKSDDTDGDKTLLGSLLDMMGMDGKMKNIIMGFKNLSWIPTVAGPILLAGLFTGIFDQPLSDLMKTVLKGLGVDETTLMNTGSSGKDGEEGFSDRAKKTVFRQVATGANPNYVSNLLDWAGGKFVKASDMLAEKTGFRNKVKSKIFKATGNATNKVSEFTKGVEEKLVGLRNGELPSLKKKASDAIKDGYSLVESNGKQFIYDDKLGDFVRNESGELMTAADDVAGEYIEKASSKKGLFSKAFSKVKGAFGKKAAKEVSEEAVEKGAEKVSNILKVAEKADELYGYVKNPASMFTAGIKDTVANYSRQVQNKIKNKLTGKADDVVEDAIENSDRIKSEASKIVDKLKDFFNKLIKSGKMPKEAADAAMDAADEIGDKIVETAVKSSGKKALKKKALQQIKDGIAQMGPIGWAAAVAFAMSDYSNGYSECEKIIGVEDPTTGERVITGLMACIRGLLEMILGMVKPLEVVTLAVAILVSNKDIANTFINTIGKKLTPEIVERRDQYANKVKSYNSKTGKSYDVEQYEYTVKNNKGFFAKEFAGLKSLFKGQKWLQKELSGTDEEGNLVADWLDESTKRWKYYQKAIDKGNISREYAQALYMNECLHDPEYILTEDRIADFKKRIAEYKSTQGAGEIPEITTKLPGLIEKGTVTQQGTGSSWMVQNVTQNASYGNGKSSDSYTGMTSSTSPLVGSFATGGITDRSGYAALSKGEYVVDLKKKGGLSEFISGLFGSSKSSIDTKDYDDLTDVSSVVEDMMSMDSNSTNWKGYWDSIDKSIGNGPLAPLKRLLRRIAASLAMPSFALGKVVDSVQGMYDVALGTGAKSSATISNPSVAAADYSSAASSSYSSSATTGSTTTTTVNSTVSPTTKKSGGLLSKAISKVKGFFGGLFGKGSGLYGGASGLGETVESDDGTFISQMGATGLYGDSSYEEEGCAPATAAMFINSINKGGMTLQQAGDYAIQKGYKVKGDGTKEEYFNDIFSANGIPTENINTSKGIYEALKAGKPTILLGQDSSNVSKDKSPFGTNPHYIMATGVDNDGNIIVNDPESREGGTKYSPSVLNKVKSAISTKMQGGRSGLYRKRPRKFYGGSTDDERKKTIWDFLVHDQKMTEYAAAGIMGCWQIESSNNPKRVECDYIASCKADAATATDSLDNLHNYTVNHVFPAYTKIKIHKEGYAGGDGRYYCGLGLAQWTGPRTKRLIEFSNEHGLAWNDLSGQLSFFMSEFNGAYSSVKASVNAATSVADATKIFLKGFEGSSKGLTERTNEAQKIYNSFHGTEKDTDVSTFVTTIDGSGDSSTSTGAAVQQESSGLFGSVFDNALRKIYGDTMFNAVFNSSGSAVTDSGTTGSTATSGTSGGITSSDGSIGQNVAVDAANYIGNKYVWGGNDLDNGVDCSGFVQQLYKKHGFDALANARGNTKSMWADQYGNKVGNDISALQPGDVMYFSSNGSESGIHHVGIYAGNNHMIHAQSTNSGIVDTDLSTSSYYKGQFFGAERYGAGSGLMKNKVIPASKLFGGASSSTGSKVLDNRKAAQADKDNQSIVNSISRLTSSGKANAAVGLDNLISGIDSIRELLEKLVSNTDAIATIANLITELVGGKKDTNSMKGKSKSSSSNSYDNSESQAELENMVNILTQLAKA